MHKKFNILSAKKALQLVVATGLLLVNNQANAQSTTSHSPYSKFGLGQMREDLLPQTRAMGGISSAIRYQSGLPILNMGNPASYSAFSRTILEAGLYGNATELSRTGVKDNTADFAFSHLAIGIPLSQRFGGLAFGLMPYSDVGYNGISRKKEGDLTYDVSSKGEGGVNKAFFGYGISPIKGISIGANVGFLFGELTDIKLVSFPQDPYMLNAQRNETRLIRGATVDYGIQYSKAISRKLNLTVGYMGSLNNTITSKTTSSIKRTEASSDPDYQNIPLDTVSSVAGLSRKVNLPLKHTLGFTLSKGYNWMVGADVKYADWSNFQTRANEPKLGKNYGFAVGGQIKPDPTSVKYWNIVDYRLGFRYDQTPLQYNNKNIDDMAVTVGLGLPLPETNFGLTFSRINISAEFGQRGSLSNNLIRERYINLNLGFTLNDTWFRRRSYD
ncbi:porin family protein [Sphingobacterium faecale]|uniref:Long-subunit fatty acid transport protein n=1 Tax=Sphingobacterium faecale TaxID=2803775 RepID=A0ABS1R896_9SPHI|nr:hypothetical protein [Sphingobacterium faecale]MBL1410942.1 hypothetical protein [Sphingobacterium faecale]